MPFLPTDLWDRGGGGAKGVFTDIRPEIWWVGGHGPSQGSLDYSCLGRWVVRPDFP